MSFVLFGIFVLILGIMMFSLKEWEMKNEQIEEMTRISAPEFEGKTKEGQKIDDSIFIKKVTLVHFWATWCAPCTKELPEVVSFVSSYQNSDFQLLLVSLDENWSEAESFLKKIKLPQNTISILDPEQRVSEKFGSYQYPESYVVDQKADIVAKWIGPQQWNHPFFSQTITKITNRVK